MPGLNRSNNKIGLSNIDAIMEKRELPHSTNIEIKQTDNKKEEQKRIQPATKGKNVTEIDAKEKLYARAFSTVGNVLRKRYEENNPPRLHKQFYAAIKSALNGETSSDTVILTPILEELEIGRSTAIIILACFEQYGYMRFERRRGERGRMINIEILRDISS